MSLLLGIGIPVAYAAVGFLAAVGVYRLFIARMARHELKKRAASDLSDYPLVNELDRFDATSAAWLTFFLWPIVPILLAVGLAVSLLTSEWKAPAERELTDRRELAALRRQAKDLNLPMPGGDR